MKEFIISILNLMGFGVNALVRCDGNIFIGKLNEYVPDVKCKLCSSDDKGMVICVDTPSGDGFKIVYTFYEGTRRIKGIDIEV